ncbi:MAG: hypothetical protein R3351_02990 [Nitrospirales bacterium]|nr:hypothetical protein [Nitrospirales bacterium]
MNARPIFNWPLQSDSRPSSYSRITVALTTLSFIIGGCSAVSPSSHMPTLIEQDPHPSLALQGKISQASQQKLQVGLAFVPEVVQSHPPTTLSKDSLERFTARTKSALENKVPLDIQDVVRLETLQPGKSVKQLQGIGKDEDFEFVIVIMTSSDEVTTPAYLDASAPDVGILPGNEIQNYALVEVALVDLQSGKSLIQAHGRSYALLEQLDVPIESNRYPLVKGSANGNRFYPTDDMALEVLRTVALEEALDQAIMKFDIEWRETITAPSHRRS